jgi:2-keto-4-pentenoate hydratase/2-oxohepta-3-ene-1,7-dioic acid hydratase in catechol pathway
MKIRVEESQSPVSVGKLLCIGRNYADHAAEMKREVPDRPMVFLKPATALVRSGGTVELPPQSQNVHHEVELVAVIGTEGRCIPRAEALDHVGAYAVGLDITARDLQDEAKQQRHPWSVAKGFDTFAPLGPLAPAATIDDPHELTLQLDRNGERRQTASTEAMMFSVRDLVHYCSQIFTLEPGDLLYTGTPAGVGRIEDGDVLKATATGCEPLRIRVARREP